MKLKRREEKDRIREEKKWVEMEKSVGRGEGEKAVKR